MGWFARFLLPPLLLPAAFAGPGELPEEDEAPDFRRDVLPILTGKCFTCHGPDEATREGDLRLDDRDELYKEIARDLFVVAPGDTGRSELYWRVTTDSENDRMPPFWSDQPKLDDSEVATLRRWIESGAEWSGHWAYEPPSRPEPPAVEDESWPRGVIDRFVLARLEREGLAPSPEADRATLIRRLSLDLTGLPPTLEEVDAFLADESPDAYERVVERLFASPHYGEKQARLWLDLARYADTHGYEKDETRTMWRYRDWVIDAFNADMPFDRFTREQIAGDLLPEPTNGQLVATGFHRNTMVNREGGVDAEEFRVDAVIDRVNTTASVWLGTTLACAQCHSHKYDPFSQREYYGLFAYFNSTEDSGSSVEPILRAPDRAQAERLAEYAAKLADYDAQLAGPMPEVDAAQAAWEREALASLPPPVEWRAPEPLGFRSRNGAALTLLDDGTLLAEGERPPRDAYEVELRPGPGRVTALKLEPRPHPSLTGNGRADDGNFVVTDVELHVASLVAPSASRRVRFAGATANFEQTSGRFPPVHAIDVDPESGWAVAGHTTRDDLEAVFALREPLELGPDDVVRVVLRHEYGGSAWTLGRFRLSFTDHDEPRERALTPPMDGWELLGPLAEASGEEAFAKAYPAETGSQVDGWEAHPEWIDARVHAFPQSENSAFLVRRRLTAARPRRAILKLGSDDALKVFLNGKLVHEKWVNRGAARGQEVLPVDLVAGTNELLLKVVNNAGPTGFCFEIANDESDRLPDDVADALRDGGDVSDWYRRNVAPAGRKLVAKRTLIEQARDELNAKLPATMVMRERAEPRETRLLIRGSFLNPGDPVEPGVPAVLNELPASAPPTRLGLADWLVDPANPLVARVTVNRFWEQLFGRGLVETSEDFGTRGDPPSHPELLDRLASDFVANGWSVKELHRAIVTSATYRQSSDVTPELLERDPYNRLLARGARFRVEAEAVRDVTLAIAGLLATEIGGPSVFPPQPDGIWAMTYSGEQWNTATDADRYRRGVYTFLRRTAPYPTFAMFDATSREVTCTRRARTNTPLQALAALNDPAFLEAAGGLARRMAGGDDAKGLRRGFRLCTAREPEAGELDVLAELLASERAFFAEHPERAAELDAAAAPFAKGRDDAPELAAWTVVANALLNLDETLTQH